jgi:hypothetical protein
VFIPMFIPDENLATSRKDGCFLNSLYSLIFMLRNDAVSTECVLSYVVKLRDRENCCMTGE